jgi:hypothetical protein
VPTRIEKKTFSLVKDHCSVNLGPLGFAQTDFGNRYSPDRFVVQFNEVLGWRACDFRQPQKRRDADHGGAGGMRFGPTHQGLNSSRDTQANCCQKGRMHSLFI